MTREFEVPCPPDKSITHRAFILSALANGVCRVRNPLLSADTLATLDCIEQLGAGIRKVDEGVEIVPLSLSSSAPSKSVTLDCANSGTTVRLLMGVVASLPGWCVRFTGDKSLTRRPMGRVVEPLRGMGARIEMSCGTLPVEVRGVDLQPQRQVIPMASAQVKSSILLAALHAVGKTSVRLPVGSRDHTENMLASLGVTLEINKEKAWEEISVVGPQKIRAFDITVPGDPSSAAFLCVRALLNRTGVSYWFRNIAATPTRTEFLKIMQTMTGKIEITPSPESERFCEPVIDFRVTSAPMIQPCTVQPEQVPALIDEVPVLATLAAFANGPSVFRGVGELRVKESDRLEKIKELLTRAGAHVAVEGDDLIVRGGLSEVQGFDYDPAGDHRLAMCAAILAERSRAVCTLQNKECVDVSFPGFFSLLESIC